MATMTYTLNTRTPAGGYQIVIASSGVMLWAVAIKCSQFWGGGDFVGWLLRVLDNQTFIP